jgi:hypothetical protein
VETALIIVGNANHERLRETGNFVVADSVVIRSVSEKGLWRLQCPSEKRTLPSPQLPKIQGQSGISESITTSGQSFMGSPAIPYISFLKSFSVFKQLPSLILRLQKIEKKLNLP